MDHPIYHNTHMYIIKFLSELYVTTTDIKYSWRNEVHLLYRLIIVNHIAREYPIAMFYIILRNKPSYIDVV